MVRRIKDKGIIRKLIKICKMKKCAEQRLDEGIQKLNHAFMEEWAKNGKTWEHFTEIMIIDDEFREWKIIKNKKMNFRLKKLFLGCFFLMPMILSVYLFYYGIVTHKRVFSLEERSLWIIGIVILLLLAYGITKILDVKKYQETWARHRSVQYKIMVEKLMYLEELSPYKDPAKRNQIFVERIIKIWSGNTMKFESNMENKEKELVDFKDVIVAWLGK